jgi:hypothetical protein
MTQGPRAQGNALLGSVGCWIHACRQRSASAEHCHASITFMPHYEWRVRQLYFVHPFIFVWNIMFHVSFYCFFFGVIGAGQPETWVYMNGNKQRFFQRI